MLDKNHVNDKNIQNDLRKADIFALFYLLTLLYPDQEQTKKKTLFKLNQKLFYSDSQKSMVPFKSLIYIDTDQYWPNEIIPNLSS